MLSTVKNYALVGLGACLLLTCVLLNRAYTQLAEKTAVIDSMHREAQAYKEKSETTSKEISDAHQALLEQIKAKDIAIKNARARFGSCTVVRGIGTHGVLPDDTGAGKADVPESSSGPSVEERLAVTSEFVNGCAEDAAFVRSTHEWRVKENLPISKD